MGRIENLRSIIEIRDRVEKELKWVVQMQQNHPAIAYDIMKKALHELHTLILEEVRKELKIPL